MDRVRAAVVQDDETDRLDAAYERASADWRAEAEAWREERDTAGLDPHGEDRSAPAYPDMPGALFLDPPGWLPSTR